MSKLSEKKVIGITGSMGSGKSEIARYLRNKYPVLDCDQVNADLLKKGNLGYQKLKEMNIVELDSQGQIIKESLASYMFSSEQNRKCVEAILHPLIFEKCMNGFKIKINRLFLWKCPCCLKYLHKNILIRFGVLLQIWMWHYHAYVHIAILRESRLWQDLRHK